MIMEPRLKYCTVLLIISSTYGGEWTQSSDLKRYFFRSDVRELCKNGSSDVVPIAKIIDSSPPALIRLLNNAPDKAIDCNPRTFWNAGNPAGNNYNNWYITFELAKKYTVTSVSLISYEALGYNRNVTVVKLEASDDKVTWHNGGTISKVRCGSNKWKHFDGFNASGNYLKFTITRTFRGLQPYILELDFKGYQDQNSDKGCTWSTATIVFVIFVVILFMVAMILMTWAIMLHKKNNQIKGNESVQPDSHQNTSLKRHDSENSLYKEFANNQQPSNDITRHDSENSLYGKV